MLVMRYLTSIFTVVIVALMMSGCFKDEIQGTLFKIRVTSQESADAELVPCTTELRAYAFYTKKGEKWEVKSWDDALAMKITNKDRATETLTKPDVIGTWSSTDEYQLTLDLKAKYTTLVVVDVENKLYAYRDYETPMNIPEIKVELHLYAWRKTGSANGWTVVNTNDDTEKQ